MKQTETKLNETKQNGANLITGKQTVQATIFHRWLTLGMNEAGQKVTVVDVEKRKGSYVLTTEAEVK